MFAKEFRILLFTLLVLSSMTSVRAVETWTRTETPNFEVVGNATDVEIKGVTERLERFRKALSTIIAVRPNPTKTRVIVFRDDAAFRPFKPKKADGTPDDLVAGLFQPGEDVNYIVIAGGGADLSTIFHEYTHDALNTSFGHTEIPAWLNEGLAEYFQTFRIIDGGTAELGRAPKSNLSMLQRGPLIPWDEFFAIDNYSLQQKGPHSRTMFYAQAWAVVQLLIHDASASRLLDPKTLQGRIREIDHAKLSENLTDLVAAGTEPTVLTDNSIKVALPGPVGLSEDRANAYLGDLLYHMKDYAGAETYLKIALAGDTKMPSANASLGMVRLRQRRFAEAKRLLENAVASDADNHLVHYYYAYLLTRENMDGAGLVSKFPASTAEQIRRSLRRAIRLNDQFVESYRLLAFTALVTNEGLDEALAGLKKAEALRPGDSEVSLMVPQILLRQEKAEEAREAASTIFRSTSDPRVKKEAESLLRSAALVASAVTHKGQIVIGVAQQPVIYQRKDLTDEQFGKLMEDRVVNNVNGLIERPGPGELQAVGALGKISCVDGRIGYIFKTDSGKELRLTGQRFDDLRLKVLIEGTRSFAFRCGAMVTDELTVITYRPPARPTPGNNGELLSIAFVPRFFRLKSLAEVAMSPQVIVQGGPTTPVEENARVSAAEREAMERTMRETQLRDIDERLRAVGDGEIRTLATPEKVECSSGRMMLSARDASGVHVFSAAIADRFDVASFNPEAGIVEVGCTVQLPALPAVITFREKPNGRELISVEFVPKFFSLNKN